MELLSGIQMDVCLPEQDCLILFELLLSTP